MLRIPTICRHGSAPTSAPGRRHPCRGLADFCKAVDQGAGPDHVLRDRQALIIRNDQAGIE
jgi:hypothetical protein